MYELIWPRSDPAWRNENQGGSGAYHTNKVNIASYTTLLLKTA